MGMTTALEGSLKTLCWAIVVLFTGQVLFALVVSHACYMFFLDPSVPVALRQEVFVYFGTFDRAMLSMFEVTLANWPPICRTMQENVGDGWWVFFVLHKLFIGFAVVAVITGVFIQETFRVASTNDQIMVRQKDRAKREHETKMMRFFKAADTSGDGILTVQEFKQIAQTNDVKIWLSAMDLQVEDVEVLWSLIDDGNGELEPIELIRGVSKLKGAARSIDLMTLARDVKRLNGLLAPAGFENSSDYPFTI